MGVHKKSSFSLATEGDSQLLYQILLTSQIKRLSCKNIFCVSKNPKVILLSTAWEIAWSIAPGYQDNQQFL